MALLLLYIENSWNLITCHVHIQAGAVVNSREFRTGLEKKYSHRKLFLCGNYRLAKGKLSKLEVYNLYLVLDNMDFVSLWDHFD